MNRGKRHTPSLACLGLIFAMTGCGDGGGREDVDTSKTAEYGFQASVQTSLESEGKFAYETYCIGCHGEKGDGNGEAARFLHPRPRNFQLAFYKFASRRSGQLPLDSDLKRTIKEGLRGSAMPSFALLPERKIDALVEYLKTFSPKWKEQTTRSPIPILDDPFASDEDKSEVVRRGEAIYHGFATCWSCHPAYVPEARINEIIVSFGKPAREGFRPNLLHSEGKPNNEGELIYPPDFKRDFVRAGSDVEDLYRSIAAGITGTAMPTWVDAMHMPGATPDAAPLVDSADLWAVAYYVQDLIKQRPAKLTAGMFETRLRPQAIYLHGEPPPASQPVEETPQENVDFGF